MVSEAGCQEPPPPIASSRTTQLPASSIPTPDDYLGTKQESDQVSLILRRTQSEQGNIPNIETQMCYTAALNPTIQKSNKVGDIFIVSKYIVFLKVISQRFLTRLPTTIYI